MSGSQKFGNSIVDKLHESNKRSFARDAVAKRNEAADKKTDDMFSKDTMAKSNDKTKTQFQLLGKDIADTKDQVKKTSGNINGQLEIFIPLAVGGAAILAFIYYNNNIKKVI
jgi:hypothetical protein